MVEQSPPDKVSATESTAAESQPETPNLPNRKPTLAKEIKIEDPPTAQESEQERKEREEHLKISKEFTDWCARVGIKFPKFEYPAYFEGGLVGAKVTQPIDHREAFLFVPYDVIISVDKAKRNPDLNKIIVENPELFSTEHGDWEQLILCIFLMYETQKGDSSFWAPYLKSMPTVTFFCDFDQSAILATEDYQLVVEAMDYKEEIFGEWDDIKACLDKYPEIFKKEFVKPELFKFLYAQVCTRCFGWGLPYTAMVPVADTLNHSDVSIMNEVMCKSKHLEADENSSYFTRMKYMNNYQEVFDMSLLKTDADVINVQGRLNRENFESNQQFYKSYKLKEFIESGKQLWEVPFVLDHFYEDNDSDEEESSEEEEEELAKMIDVVKGFLTGVKTAKDEHFSKGLEFFVKTEKAQLARIRAKELKEMKVEEVDEQGNPLNRKLVEYRDISEDTLNDNEWLQIKQKKQPEPVKQVLKKIRIPKDNSSDESEETGSEDSDEEFDWYDGEKHDKETYFCFINHERRILQPGEQAFNCYGNRSNKFLLMNYGFAFPNNRYDSYIVNMRMDCDLKEPFIPNMVDFKGTERMIQPCKLKIDQLNDMMLAYLRSVCKQSFFASIKRDNVPNMKRILLTKPVNLFYEKYVIMYYKQVLMFLKANIEKTSSLEKDLEMLKYGPDQPRISWQLRMSIVYRSEKKKIVRSQLHLIQKVQDVLQRLEQTLTQNPSGEPQKDLDKEYTNLLMEETQFEKEQKASLDAYEGWDAVKKERKIEKWNYQFYYRRLINSDYFRDLKSMILENDYL